MVECCKDIIQDESSVSNIYLNRSLGDLYLFKGLHGFDDNALLKAEDYLKRILKISLVNFEEIESGNTENVGEISDKMVTEGKCAKNQEVIFDGLYNLALLYLNLGHRGSNNAPDDGYLKKARTLALFGLKSFENNSPFWLSTLR